VALAGNQSQPEASARTSCGRAIERNPRGITRKFCGAACRIVGTVSTRRRNHPDPTPSQIAERSAKIRATWDEATEARHAVLAPTAWEIQHVNWDEGQLTDAIFH